MTDRACPVLDTGSGMTNFDMFICRSNKKQFQNTLRHTETFENLPFAVPPAKAGVQKVLKRLDSGLRRNDD
jgi:hypothetical protein